MRRPGRSEEESSVPLLPVSVYPPVVSGSEEGKKENPSLESLEKLELELDLPEVMAELQVKALEAIHLETAKEECQLRLVAAAGLASTASLRLEPKNTYVCTIIAATKKKHAQLVANPVTALCQG